MTDDPAPWETIDRTIVHSTPEFDVVETHVRLPDGAETTVTHLHEPPAVVILPFTPDGEIVVIEEWRQAVGHTSRSVPAGSVDEPETIEAAARRELREETGYVADRIDGMTSVEPANGISDTVHHHVVARACTPTDSQDLDLDEQITVETTDLETLRDGVHSGTIRDGRTVLAVLLHAFRNP